MAIYTVHVPDEADILRAADRTVFVREGFSWLALIFGPLWLLARRLWRALAGWIVLVIVLALGAYGLDMPPRAASGLMLLTSFWLGLEGNQMRRGALARAGYRLADVVSGVSRDEAEARFFRRRAAGVTDLPPPAFAAPARGTAAASAATPAVIGLFPDSRGRA